METLRECTVISILFVNMRCILMQLSVTYAVWNITFAMLYLTGCSYIHIHMFSMRGGFRKVEWVASHSHLTVKVKLIAVEVSPNFSQLM